MEFEWILHNIAYEISFGKDARAEDLNAGASIFCDDHGNISVAMKIAYIAIYSPIFVIWDLIANGGFN